MQNQPKSEEEKREIEEEEEEEEWEEGYNDIFRSLNIAQIEIQDFKKKKLINTNNYTNYYKIKKRDDNRKLGAIVFLFDFDSTNKQNDYILLKQKIFNEVSFLSSISHPSIIKIIGYSPIGFKQEKNPVVITEYCKNGSLQDCIRNCYMNDTMKLINIYGIALAMSYLHSHDILHRSLSPNNILVDKFMLPKIYGFDLVANFPLHEIEKKVVGVPSYIAPEIWSDCNYTKAGDVYAFAMLIYAILEGNDAFENASDCLIMYKITIRKYRPKFSNKISAAWQNLIKSCWNEDLNQRPSFDDIVNQLRENDDFISNDIDENLYRSVINIFDDELRGIDSTERKERLFFDNR